MTEQNNIELSELEAQLVRDFRAASATGQQQLLWLSGQEARVQRLLKKRELRHDSKGSGGATCQD